jgi:hypothetical protein
MFSSSFSESLTTVQIVPIIPESLSEELKIRSTQRPLGAVTWSRRSSVGTSKPTGIARPAQASTASDEVTPAGSSERCVERQSSKYYLRRDTVAYQVR